MAEINTPQDAISRIWYQLNESHRSGISGGVRTAHRCILEQEWGHRCDIQDILWETDDRADTLMRHHDDFDHLLNPCGLIFQSRFRGPFGNVKEVVGHQAMRAADVAMFVMEIERLGFTVDAEPLVAGLRVKLLKQRYLTNSELSVIWYGQQRHRLERIVLRANDVRPTEAKTIVTHSGYKATALLEKDKAVVLRVDAPRVRASIPLKYWISAELGNCGEKEARHQRA